MTKFDSEDLMEMVESIMRAGGALNAKIAEIEAEKTAKGKGLLPAIKSVADNAYFAQSWTKKILNANPAIFYGIENVSVASVTGAVAKTYTIFCEVVLVDDGQSNDIDKRISRYARALEELFIASFQPALGGGTVKIEGIRPMSFRLELDSSEEIKIGGISISITLV